MDTSKEYVIMRIKAKDDLDWAQTAIGLHRKIVYENDGYTVCSDENANYFVLHSEYGLFQLERQDQLQEMCNIIANDYRGLFKIFGEEIYKTKYDKFKSPEQLWLAFVMSEKFNKQWSDSEWVTKK